MENEIVASGNGAMLPPDDAKIIQVDRKSEKLNVPAVLGYIAQSANLASIAGSIKKGMQYVVEVPTHLQPDLNTGELEMLQGKGSGKTWATVVRKLSNGKNEFVANCPIKEQALYQGNPIQELSTGVFNMQMQQQMDALRQLAEDTYETARRIEQGQQDDREGLLISGKNDVVLALMETDEEARKRQMELARSKISTGQAQIGKTLKSLAEGYSPVPKSRFRRNANEFFRGGYLKRKDAEYYRIQDYYQLYLQATQLLAGSFAICGYTERAEKVYDSAKSFIESIDFRNVQTFSHMYPKEDPREMFFSNATDYIETEKTLCLEEARPYEYIAISLPGEELMEVIENVQQEI